MEVKNKKILLLHCFPVPYRNHLFSAMSNEARKRNLIFEVEFYDKWDESRPTWKFESKDLDYPHKFWKPIFKRGHVLHFNVDLLKYIIKSKPDLIISGGVWSSFNSVILILFFKFNLIAWDETNRFDFGSQKKNLIQIKRFLIEKIKYFAIPGLESWYFYKEMLTESQLKSKVFLDLPNLVDEKIFETNRHKATLKEIMSSKYNIDIKKRIIYWPARFIPDKGIIEFIDKLNFELFDSWQIVLIGNGILKDQIKNKIKEKHLEDIFIIIETLPYDEAINFYFISDLFIMPSISDSNPLSIIEAIHSSLPILVSNRVGNLNEVLVEGINGYSLDPFDKNSVISSLENILKKSEKELFDMGQESKIIANSKFNTKNVVEQFFNDIVNHFDL